MEQRREGGLSWMGTHSDAEGYMVLSSSGKDIQGTIIKGNDVYQVELVYAGETDYTEIDGNTDNW